LKLATGSVHTLVWSRRIRYVRFNERACHETRILQSLHRLRPCLCGAVKFEIDYPAFWAWHDHTRASRLAHGAVYATYVGVWRKRFRVTAGEDEIARYEDKAHGGARSFCRRCGTPLIYERARSRHMINIPRALFESRTGRQPIYHIGYRRGAGLGLRRRAARAAQGLSRRGVDAAGEEEAGSSLP
jgi:hypothetical protein